MPQGLKDFIDIAFKLAVLAALACFLFFYGEGRSVAWTSDIGPHWLPNSFVEWPGYATLWKNVLGWVTKAS